MAEVCHGMGRLRRAEFAGTVRPSTVVVPNVLREHHTQVERTGEQAALAEAVDVTRQAVTATPIDHPHRAMRLAGLGSALLRLFERTGELADITTALEMHAAPSVRPFPGRSG
jgi:DNA-binding XRE family transcriptional regulator